MGHGTVSTYRLSPGESEERGRVRVVAARPSYKNKNAARIGRPRGMGHPMFVRRLVSANQKTQVIL